MCLLPACRHTAVVCLMLWKLILVGDVGIDMARATRTRRAWLSCQRCHRFLTADRTWRGENGHGFLLIVTAPNTCQVKTEGMHWLASQCWLSEPPLRSNHCFPSGLDFWGFHSVNFACSPCAWVLLAGTGRLLRWMSLVFRGSLSTDCEKFLIFHTSESVAIHKIKFVEI